MITTVTMEDAPNQTFVLAIKVIMDHHALHVRYYSNVKTYKVLASPFRCLRKILSAKVEKRDLSFVLEV